MTAGIGKVTLDSPMAGAPSSWQPGMTVNAQSDGSVTLGYPDGTVLSVQPDGSWQTRPKGTAGLYEKATINGGTIAYGYEWDGLMRGPFVYLFLPMVPNS